ncbi:hypothetical protein FIA58_002410 [Flavobacterium jejuense]|uniref:Uncharacterized protein n=1 Tax=Flavobacterium jejuense TaxID=1544455 RepID=A0ABX0IL24_9FLAO|nr:hypothetical protein [Flavobacterium jejuense]NHN24517.1 hypothetical protein [Flavobacterium jejuense]
MEKRDYIESMIEQLGNSLRKMLSFLIKGNNKENEIEMIATIDRDFLTEFKISIDELILLSNDDFKKKIIELKLKENHIEILSQLFLQMSWLDKLFNDLKVEKLKEKAILCLDIADFVSNSFSVERINKKKEILNSK